MKTNRNTLKILLLVIVAAELNEAQDLSINEDGQLNFTSILQKYGLNVKEYEIITEDGYILKLFRVPGDQTRPILLVHGVIESVYTFVIRGNESLTYALAEANYDIWLINLRGVEYSREHIFLNISNPKFWDFSFHETGYYDLPATIDFILDQTNQKQISAIGNSQGNTIFYVLGATRPEYNQKIKIMLALAPICFLGHLGPPLKYLIENGQTAFIILDSILEEEILAEGSFYKEFINRFCKAPFIGYYICINLFNSITGEDNEEFGPDIYYTLMGHFPATTSKKTYKHIVQNAVKDDFGHFDYGEQKNREIYGSETPPKYDLNKVTMNVVLFAAKNDKLAPIEDVERLRDSLPNVEYKIMEREKFNHMDYTWGRNMRLHLFPHVFNILNKYNS